MEFINIFQILRVDKQITARTLHQAIMSTLLSVVCVWFILSVLLGIIGEIFWHKSGLYGALLGVCLGTVFFMLSSAVTLFAIGFPPQIMMGITMGAWLVKLIFFIVILAFLKKQDFFSHQIFGCAVLCSIVFVLIAQMVAIKLKTLPIVDDME